MSRTIKALTGAALTLAVGVGVQVAVYHQSAPSPTYLHASWTFTPKTSQELDARAQSIVLARVVSVTAGPDIVTKQPQEPAGVDRIPTRRITVEVLKPYKGSATAGEQLTLFQTGGAVLPPAPSKGTAAQTHVQQLVLDGDPVYRTGEQYLLMLEPGPQGTLRTVSPEGRYRYDSGSGALTAMVNTTVAKQVSASRLTALEPALRAAN